MNRTYLKVTNYLEIHNEYIYKSGLNILDKEFEENGSCVPGGLYFTTAEHIHEFYEWGCNLRVITLPTTDPNFRMVRDGNKFRANMIILGNKYSLFDDFTYKLFNLKPLTPNQIIEIMCSSDDVDVLEMCIISGYFSKLNSSNITSCIKRMAQREYINGLNWFMNRDPLFNKNKFDGGFIITNRGFGVLKHFCAGRFDVWAWLSDYCTRIGERDIIDWLTRIDYS